jgi:2-aminomuconate deaminase
MSTSISTTHAAKPVGAYPHALRVGQFLYLSGIGPRSATDNSIPGLVQDDQENIVAYDFEGQVHNVMANIKAVLEASQAKWENLIDITVFLTNMKKDFAIFNKIYAEYFNGENKPCRTTVEVNALPTPIAIELKCVAYIGDGE